MVKRKKQTTTRRKKGKVKECPEFSKRGRERNTQTHGRVRYLSFVVSVNTKRGKASTTEESKKAKKKKRELAKGKRTGWLKERARRRAEKRKKGNEELLYRGQYGTTPPRGAAGNGVS